MGQRNTEIEESFLRTYDAHADALFGYIFRRVYNRELAKELTQEAFLKTWEYLAQGKKVKHLKTFLYTVATHLIIDHARKKKDISLETHVEIKGDIVKKGTDWAGALDAKHMLKKVDLLEEPYKTAFTLRYIDELTPKEIAEALGEPVNVISVRIHRGKKQFLAAIGA